MGGMAWQAHPRSASLILMAETISPQKQRELQARMAELEIQESDIEERFIRASGPGGQKVNKTAVAVRLLHIPSGLEVRCQQSRSQAVNRFLARRRLIDKIEAQLRGALSAEQQRIAKIRRQKRKRSKRAQEKILEQKKHQSQKKQLRKRPEAE